MPNKTTYVPVDPEGFGCGLLLGLIIRYWRQLLIAAGFLVGCIFAGTIAQVIISAISTANQAHVAATQAVTDIAEENRQLDTLVKDREFYVAASLARAILSKDPSNDHAKSQLATIAGHVTGGLAGKNGVYYPFGSDQSITFVSGLHGMLVRVSTDGQRGLIVNGENHDSYSIMNFSDGRFVSLDGYNIPSSVPSSDLTRVALNTSPFQIKNIIDNSIQDVSCADFKSGVTWSEDSHFITELNGDEVIIVDTQSGACRSVSIPGLSRGGLTLTDGQSIWIVLPGDFQSTARGELFIANMDGSSLRKLADLPISGRDSDSTTFLAPDSSAIYLSEGYLVSTRTGQVVNATANSIGWLETDPIPANTSHARLTIQPESGPRGTRFSFLLEGGEPGMEVDMRIDPGDNAGFPIYVANDQGRIEDTPGNTFGMQTDINTAAGVYTVTIMSPSDSKPIAAATFTVTGP